MDFFFAIYGLKCICKIRIRLHVSANAALTDAPVIENNAVAMKWVATPF